MSFLAGLILGAVVGVVADRIWQVVERHPRLEIRPAYFQTVDGIEGLQYEITNSGLDDIPDYNICLFHPKRGSLLFFGTEQKGPLGRKQIRQHRLVLLTRGKPSEIRGWLFQEAHELAKEVSFSEFRFRLIMKNSDAILFESEAIGNALAEHCVRTFQTGNAATMTYEDSLAMGTPPLKKFRWWWRRFLRSTTKRSSLGCGVQ